MSIEATMRVVMFHVDARFASARSRLMGHPIQALRRLRARRLTMHPVFRMASRKAMKRP